MATGVHKLNIAVLISGEGTNLQALIDACKDPQYPAYISLVISSKPNAKGLDRARLAGIPVLGLSRKDYPDRSAMERRMHEALAATRTKLVCLAGYMLLLGEDFVERWRGRMINIHPSLLPLFKGLKPQQQALDAGVLMSGASVHYVVPEMDSGPLIAQAGVPVRAGDTAETLAERIKRAEHVLYPHAVRLIAEGCVQWDGEARSCTIAPDAEIALWVRGD